MKLPSTKSGWKPFMWTLKSPHPPDKANFLVQKIARLD